MDCVKRYLKTLPIVDFTFLRFVHFNVRIVIIHKFLSLRIIFDRFFRENCTIILQIIKYEQQVNFNRDSLLASLNDLDV